MRDSRWAAALWLTALISVIAATLAYGTSIYGPIAFLTAAAMMAAAAWYELASRIDDEH
ncbi:hypothetical protein [Corynebacterium sp. AOP40-4SA-5]|uniref:hypothetical protein n=1 Tax=Corynebacterium sp. AOP40-4SA-5 TaxID=3457678 RepID=UPI004034DA3B